MKKPFSETLSHLGAGVLMEDAADKLAQAVLAVDQTGKPASITLTVKLRKATAGALALTGEIKVKMPPEPKVEALLFATPEGNLLTSDPRQQMLDLKEVSTQPTTFKMVKG